MATQMAESRHRHGKTGASVGAVVVGGDFLGLGIVRSLGRHGIPVCVIDDEFSIARFSTYTWRAIRVDDLRDEARIVESVLRVGRQFGLDGWVLYPTREEMVAAFSRHRDVLSQQYRVPTPEWTITKWAWDKRNTYKLAEMLGIPIPRTWCVRDPNDLNAIGEGSFVIKPAIKEHFVYATKQKAWRADTRAELPGLVAQAASLVGPGEVMVQELIPGDGSNQFACCVFFKDGEALGSMVAQRRRQHPPEFGRASTYVYTLDVPELEDLSHKLLKSLRYYGLAELEYKFDARTREYKLLDFNARAWGYHTLGGRAGVDFPYLLFADQIGEPIEPCRANAGVHWIRFITDLPTGVLEIVQGRLGLGEYLRSLGRFDIESVFCGDDAWPAVAELALTPYLMLKRGF